MKAFILLLIGLVCSLSLFGQSLHTQEDYVAFLKDFYFHITNDTLVTLEESVRLFGITILEDEEALFLKKCKKNRTTTNCIELAGRKFANSKGEEKSLYFDELKKISHVFTQDKAWDTIQLFIRKYDELYESTIGFDIVFPNSKVIYFYLNRYPDESIEITNLYLEDGASIDYHLAADKSDFNLDYVYLKRKGIINDPDGYVNVRKGEGVKCPIVGKVMTDEVFLFTPNYYSDWWKVQSLDGSIEGYMHKSRITPFGTLPEEKKKELKKKYQ